MENRYGEIHELLRTIRGTNSLDWIVKISEKKETFAPIGLDLAALEPMFFAAGAAEFIYSYASFLADKPRDLYDSNVFTRFEETILPRIRREEMSWAGMSPRDADFYREYFKDVFRHRRGGYWSVASSSEILRIELEDLWKENPDFRRWVAKGRAVSLFALLFLATGGGAIYPPNPAIPLNPPAIEQVNQLNNEEYIAVLKAEVRLEWVEIHRHGHIEPGDEVRLDKLEKALEAATAGHRSEAKEKEGSGVSYTYNLFNFEKLVDIPVGSISISYLLAARKKKDMERKKRNKG